MMPGLCKLLVRSDVTTTLSEYSDHDNHNNAFWNIIWKFGFEDIVLTSHISVNLRPIVLKFCWTTFEMLLQHTVYRIRGVQKVFWLRSWATGFFFRCINLHWTIIEDFERGYFVNVVGKSQTQNRLERPQKCCCFIRKILLHISLWLQWLPSQENKEGD